MSASPDHDPILAYEAQARFSVGGEWVTIAVRGSHKAAFNATFCHRDAWGRTPTEVRVVPIHYSRAA